MTQTPSDPSDDARMDRETEDRLRRAIQPRTPALPPMRLAPSRPATRATLLFPLAAALLIGLALWAWRRSAHTDPAKLNSTVAAPELPANIPPLSIVDIVRDGEGFAAVARDYASLRVRLLRTGDAVDNWTVKDITATEFRVASGNTTVAMPAGVEPPALTEHRKSLAAFWAQGLEAGTLSEAERTRCALAAKMGDLMTVAALQSLATQTTLPSREFAVEALGCPTGLENLNALATQAGEGERSRRVLALQALGRIDSPLAETRLRELLSRRDDPLLYLTIEQVARKRDPLALSALQSLADDERIPDNARAAAAAALRAMTPEAR